MKLKKIISALLLGAMVLSAGCGTKTPTTTPEEKKVEDSATKKEDTATEETKTATGSDEKVKLIIWNAGVRDSDENGVVPKDEIPFIKYQEIFKETHPNVEFEVSNYGMDQMAQLMTAASMNNDLPDLIALWAGSYTNDYEKLFIPLDDYMTQEEIDSYTGLSIGRKGMTPEGKIQALPFALTTYNVFYNKEIFEANGITEFPATWDELIQISKQIKETGVTPLLFEKGGGIDTWVLSEFLADELGSAGIMKMSNGEIKFSDPLFVDMYKEFKRVFDEGLVNEDFASIDASDVNERFLNGTGAMIFGGSWGQNDLVDIMGENVGTFQIPAYKADSPSKDSIVSQPGLNIAVTTGSKNPEIAAEFAKLITGPEYQTEMANLFGDIPSNAKSDLSMVTNPLTQESASWLPGKDAVIGFDSVISAEAAEYFYKNCIQVDAGKLSVEDLGAELDKLVVKAMENKNK